MPPTQEAKPRPLQEVTPQHEAPEPDDARQSQRCHLKRAQGGCQFLTRERPGRRRNRPCLSALS